MYSSIKSKTKIKNRRRHTKVSMPACTQMDKCTNTHKDDHVRQEKFWMDGAEQHRRCKEWSDVNNLEAAV